MTEETNAGMGTGMVIGILVVAVVLVALVVVGVGGMDRGVAPVSVPNGQTSAPTMQEETVEPAGGDGGNATQEVTLPDTDIDVPEEVDVNVNQEQPAE